MAIQKKTLTRGTNSTKKFASAKPASKTPLALSKKSAVGTVLSSKAASLRAF